METLGRASFCRFILFYKHARRFSTEAIFCALGTFLFDLDPNVLQYFDLLPSAVYLTLVELFGLTLAGVHEVILQHELGEGNGEQGIKIEFHILDNSESCWRYRKITQGGFSRPVT